MKGDRVMFTDLSCGILICRDSFPRKPILVAEINHHERRVTLQDTRTEARRTLTENGFNRQNYVRATD